MFKVKSWKKLNRNILILIKKINKYSWKKLNWGKETMNKKYGITGLILIIILATVMISGCIGDDTPTNDNLLIQ